MLCVLIEILGCNGVALRSGFTGERQVAVVAFQRIGGSVVVATAPVWSRVVSLVRVTRDQRRCGLLALRPSFIEQSLLVLVSRAPNVARVILASE